MQYIWYRAPNVLETIFCHKVITCAIKYVLLLSILEEYFAANTFTQVEFLMQDFKDIKQSIFYI